MQSSTFVVVILLLASAAYRWGKNRSIALVGGTRGIRQLHSLPAYYGMYVALWCGLPALVLLPVAMTLGGLLSLSDRRLRVGAPKPARTALQPAE